MVLFLNYFEINANFSYFQTKEFILDVYKSALSSSKTNLCPLLAIKKTFPIRSNPTPLCSHLNHLHRGSSNLHPTRPAVKMCAQLCPGKMCPSLDTPLLLLHLRFHRTWQKLIFAPSTRGRHGLCCRNLHFFTPRSSYDCDQRGQQ